MGRTLDEVLDALPADRRSGIEGRAAILQEKADAVAELARSIAAASAAMGEPSAATEAALGLLARFLCSLQSAVETAGGRFEVSAVFPDRPVLDLSDLADAMSWVGSALQQGARSVS